MQNRTAKVVDLYVVPDYVAAITPSIDPRFESYCKGDTTQLQFIFEAVDPCEDFPFGCKVTYRAFSADEVVSIRPDATETVKMKAKVCKVYIYPEKTNDVVNGVNISAPEGMYLLKQIPLISVIYPQGFTVGSRAEFVKTWNGIKNYFSTVVPDVVTQWNTWERDMIPQSDDVLEYIET